jgi:hypothetical protein
MSESNREWSIAEVAFGEVPPAPALRLESSPEAFHRSASDALRRAVADWAREHGLDDGLDIALQNDEHGDAQVRLIGLEFDEDGDIVAKEREYLWTGVITVSVSVSGTVKARSEDDAHDLAEDALRNASIESVDVDGYHGDVYYEGHDIEDHDLHDVDEQ